MTLWLDAQLAPSLAPWTTEVFPDLNASSLVRLGLLDAADLEVFMAAKDAGAVVLTKDRDFIELLTRYGPPPNVIWLSCGNTSKAAMKSILSSRLSPALAMLHAGESLVEIS